MNEILNYHLLLSYKVENASYAWIQKYKEQCNEMQEIRCISATLRIYMSWCLECPPLYILRVGAEVAMCLHGPAGVSHLEHWQSLCRVLMFCHLPQHNTTPAIVHTVIIIHPITLTPATLLHTSACRPSSPACSSACFCMCLSSSAALWDCTLQYSTNNSFFGKSENA